MGLFDTMGQPSAIDDLKRRLAGGLTAPQGAFQLPQQPSDVPSQPPPQEPPPALPVATTDLHQHKKGFVGGLMHAIGADTMSPELAGLLTPSQQEQARPGVARTLWNLVANGEGPQSVMQDRAANILKLTDVRKKQEMDAKRAQIAEKYAGQPMDYQTMAQMTGDLAAIGHPDAEKYANILNAIKPKDIAPRAPSPLTYKDNVLGQDGKPYIVGYDVTGKEVNRAPQYIKPDMMTEYQRQMLALSRDKFNKPPVGKETKLPTSAIEKMIELDSVSGLADSALNAVDAAVKSGANVTSRFGKFVPSSAWAMNAAGVGGQKGQMARGHITDLLSLVGKMRSGGAITAQEFSRLEGFLPTVDESEESVTNKLKNFKKTLADIKRIRIENWKKYGGVASPDNQMPQEDRPTLVWPEG